MDIHGNLLGSCSGGRCRYESYSRQLRPSQARIIIPYHEAFSEEGADWFAQLRALGYDDEVFFLVEVTKDVDVLKSSGFGVYSSIRFPDRQITQIEKDAFPLSDTIVVRVDVDPEQIPECQRLPDGNYWGGPHYLDQKQGWLRCDLSTGKNSSSSVSHRRRPKGASGRGVWGETENMWVSC